MDTRAFIPFAKPNVGEEEITEVVDTLRSGWLTTGAKTKKFEKDFCEFLGGGVEALAVNSATSGLHLALEAVMAKKKEKNDATIVAVPTMTFTATAEVVRYMGMEVELVDSDPDTLCMLPEDLEFVVDIVGPQLAGVIPVHYAGIPCNMGEINKIAKKNDLFLIEDAAHALPSTYPEGLVGEASASDATVFSFYANKTLTTGEGGMVVTRDKELAKRMSLMRLHGIDRDAFDRYTSKKPVWYYEVLSPGFKYNMTDVAASIGIHQLRKVVSMRWEREAIAKMYDEEFRNLPLKLLKVPKGHTSSHHLYVIRVDERETKVTRDDLIQRCSENGVGTSVHYLPLHMQPYWKQRYALTDDMFPRATKAFKTMLSLPIYDRMTEEEISRVISVIKGAF